MALINRQTQREHSADELFTFKIHACDNDIDRDLEQIGQDGLAELSALFVGKTILTDHAAKADNQAARIYKTQVEQLPGLTATGEPLSRLVVFCYTTRTESNNDFIIAVEAGIKKEASIGCRAEKRVCSICGANARDCAHRKGQSYGGRLCFHKLARFTDAYEISFVAVPAQRRAGVTKAYKYQDKKTHRREEYRMYPIKISKEFLQQKISMATDRLEELEPLLENAENVETYKALSAEAAQLEEDREAFKDLLMGFDEKKDTKSARFDPVATYKMVGATAPDSDADDDPTNSQSYRKAFREYVTKGTPIPEDIYKANANTLTSDVGSAIPTLLVNRVVEQMESLGMILPLVTKTSHPAGIEIPTSSIKPEASWVAEGKGSPRQKKTTGKIVFTHHKLRCEISMSAEVGAMALSAFETAFVRQVAEAMVKAKEQAIISGDGSGKPKGIIMEVPAYGQKLSVTELTYKTLVEAEAALPQAYEGGAVWCTTKKTFMGFIGMTDNNKQPIARVNYGIGGKPERTLLGRSVVLCGDYLPSFAAAVEDEVFAFLFNFSDYAMNEIYNMGIQRKQDWDTEDMLTKAVLSCDGKVIDKNSLVTLVKSAGA